VCAFIFWLIAFGYSLIARFDFFMKRWIRKKFFLYNALNLLQLFFLQIYLYALIEPGFSWRNHLLLVHFIFVLLNASIIEVARKLKRKKEETAARDTYSARLGIGSASLLYSILYISSYLMFIHMLSNLGASPALFYISLVPLSLIILTTMVYLLHAKKSTSKIVEGTALIFYLSMHLLLVFTAL
jgi:1,4-dihydroxy-2-naphthoate octaprenyltransferase